MMDLDVALDLLGLAAGLVLLALVWAGAVWIHYKATKK